MPKTIRFHLDENCDPRIADGLRMHGVDVTTTVDANLRTESDERQLAYALQSSFFELQIGTRGKRIDGQYGSRSSHGRFANSIRNVPKRSTSTSISFFPFSAVA